jgi:hypothetical protein
MVRNTDLSDFIRVTEGLKLIKPSVLERTKFPRGIKS